LYTPKETPALTFIAVAIISVSLNAFGVMMGPNITISTNHVNATAGTLKKFTITFKNNFVKVFYTPLKRPLH
jgi:hypothetical protein